MLGILSDSLEVVGVILLVALVIDAVIGDPEWLYRRVVHPVVWMGRWVSLCEARWNVPLWSEIRRRTLGILMLSGLVLFSVGVGLLIVYVATSVTWGWVCVAVIVSTLLAQRSLYLHVAAVGRALKENGIEEGRLAVSRIVGRKTDLLEEAAVVRASIESCAENFSDGIVAPIFWFFVAGVPGICVYKAVNTADSMVGYRSSRYRSFGWAAARLDDLMNWVPARISCILLVLGSIFKVRDGVRVLPRLVKDAQRHPSPNAGWPEAVFARLLQLALGGPRQDDTKTAPTPWINEHALKTATPEDIGRALRIMVRGLVILWSLIIILVVM